MSRYVLFILLSAAVGGTYLGVRPAETAHSATQRSSLLRETLDDAVTTLLNGAINEEQRRWKAASSLGSSFTVNRREVRIEDYHLEESGQVLAFTLAAVDGDRVVRQSSRYRLPSVGWPGPLWIDAPYAVSSVAPTVTVDGSSSTGTRSILFDATRFNDYRLGTVLNLADLPTDLNAEMAGAIGPLAALDVHDSTASIQARYGSPTLLAVVGKALAHVDPAIDVSYPGGELIGNVRDVGGYAATDTPRIVHVRGDLSINTSGRLRGGGLLLVEGNLRVWGALEWKGLVLVRSTEQELDVYLKQKFIGQIEIDGGLAIDQVALPPGGHLDITVHRDLTGTWATTAGENGWGTPGSDDRGALNSFYQHIHRFNKRVPEQTTMYMLEGSSGRHDYYTRLRESLQAFEAMSPGEQVYLRFSNVANHGHSLFHLVAGGETYEGTVQTGFGANARAGDKWASPSFDPGDLDTFILDVQNLRALRHLTDGDVPDSPFWAPSSGNLECWDLPTCLSTLPDREKTLTLQLVRDSDDAILLEGSIYWHTQGPSRLEYQQEVAEDEAWLEAIRSGTGTYGTKLTFGATARLKFNEGEVGRVLSRLGFNQLVPVHLSSYVSVETHSARGGSQLGGTLICHEGATQTVASDQVAEHLGHGDTNGRCPASS